MHLDLKTLQHFNLIVADYDQAIAHFRRVLGAHVNCELSPAYLPTGVRASLLTIGPVLFLVVGADPGAKAALKRLLDDKGPGYIGIEFTVDDLQIARRAAEGSGLRIKFDTGAFFVTDPRDSFGMAIEFFDQDWYGAAPPDPTMTPVASREYWANEHPLGVTGLDSFTVAVLDRNEASKKWLSVVGDSGREVEGDLEWLAAGNARMRLVDPETDDEVARFLTRAGERVCSVSLAVRDLEQTWKWLCAQGIEPLRPTRGVAVLPAEHNQGVRMQFVQGAD